MQQIIPVIKLMRPYQWTKNLFVFAGIIFSHQLGNYNLVLESLAVFVAFCLMSSAVYILNDWRDREVDKLHPVKKNRPLAAGTVSVRFAFSLAAVLLLTSLALTAVVSAKAISFIVLYLVINIAYSLALKHVVILDAFVVASGFMLRLLAGTEGLAIEPSKWMILCGTTIALFLAFAKRRSELLDVNSLKGDEHRKVLQSYTPQLLDALIIITATATVICYALYTVDPTTIAIHKTGNLIYTVPIVMYGLFRYLYRIFRLTGGGDPSREVFTDLHIVVTVVLWAVVTVWIISQNGIFS